MPKYSESRRFYLRGNPRGFGYEIMDKGEPKQKVFKCLFHTSSKEQAVKVFETIEENHTDFPEPETNWIPQLLSIEEKHYTARFLVRGPEELNKVALTYLRRRYNVRTEYSPFVKWDYSTYDEWIDPKAIELCGNERIKKEMIKNNEQYTKGREDVDKHNKLIDYAHAIIGNNEVRKAYALLKECEFLYYDIELETFSNDFVEV